MRAQGVCGGRVGVAGEPPAQRDIGRSVSAPVRWWRRLWRPGGAGVSRHHQNLFRFALLVRRRTARRILCVVCHRQLSKLGLEGTDGAIWRREEIEMLIAAGMSRRRQAFLNALLFWPSPSVSFVFVCMRKGA